MDQMCQGRGGGDRHLLLRFLSFLTPNNFTKAVFVSEEELVNGYFHLYSFDIPFLHENGLPELI